MKANADKTEVAKPAVGSVVNALAILRRLADDNGPRGVNAIARAVGVSPSSCFNILKTLVREEFVDFDERAKTYVLGHGAVALARRALDAGGAFELSRDVLSGVADDYGGAAALWRLTPTDRLLLIGYAEGAQETRIRMMVGQRMPMLAGAGGRCVAAHHGLSSEKIRRGFQGLRWQNPPTFETYLKQVNEAQRLGWGLDEDNFIRGVTTVAAPVSTATGKVAYVITVTVFSRQHEPNQLRELGERLIAAAAEIKRRLAL
jgi:DNA-binding IclR family transcriptional regulator